MPRFDGVPEGNFTFACLDGHTCGNPVRLVSGGAPLLHGATMSERRQDFIANHDWVRRALMFEPRGHDVMSGSILYPPTREDCDIGIIFIEVSGALPMCGHGTIGTVTMALENGLVSPRAEGRLALDAPAGRVVAEYRRDGRFVESVRIHNVPSYLAAEGVVIDVPSLGELAVDVAYGGNFYAIIDPQRNFAGLESISAGEILRLSPIVRRLVREAIEVVHPEDATIRGVSHIQWTGTPGTRAPMAATPSSMATRRSTVHPAGPAPRPAWRSWPRRASCGWAMTSSMKASSAACSRGGWRARRWSATGPASGRASPAGRGCMATTRSSSTRATPSPTASRSPNLRDGIV